MEVEKLGRSVEDIEEQQQKVMFADNVPETAHQIGTDSWFQVGFLLTSGINSVYVLGFSGTIMVHLGWTGGVIGLIIAAAISLYANYLVAKLHELGGKRHIRYRDLAGYIYGRKVYLLTWILQYVNLFMINIGYIILAGSALKAVYVLFGDGHDDLKLPYFTGMAGFVCVVFAIATPNLSALGAWLGVSTVCSLVYIIVTCTLAIRDGIRGAPRDYTIPGTTIGRIFTTIGAASNLVFSFNTGMLPEIQATIRQPAVKNMLKALYFQFSVGLVPMYAVTFIGYWAYGSSASAYLLNSVSGPTWVKAIANVCAFLQSVISLHIFASPAYEYLDTKFGLKGGAWELKNLSFRFAARGGYLGISTFVSALLPFLGDFMTLTGALSTFPLTFILANHMYLVARRSKLGYLQKLWHWLNVLFFAFMSLVATIAAFRLIFIHSRQFSVFADV